MGSVHAEFVKLKRSTSWPVVVLVPVVLVFLGAMTTLTGGGGFEEGWHTLWIRSIGFYGMAVLPVAVAILASLVWRVEHRNNNWNALMSRPVPTVQVVLGKVAAVAALAAAMQVVFVVVVLLLGSFVFDLPGPLPGEYWISSSVVVVACVPLAALQSALSTVMRSFAAPVAIALVLTGASTMLLLLEVDAEFVLPYALATQATQLGTVLASGEGTSFDAALVTPESVAVLVGVSVVMTAVVVAATSAVLDRSDTRA